ncbi:MAG: FHA domain-containing protein [Anaerolineae bacterium]|jgi:phage tail-like protein|nr:FHA domain-containing protein [Anaerolineae bacterium]
MSEIKLLFKLIGPDTMIDQIIVNRQGLRVGRTKENNLALDNREISRQHLRIIWQAEDDKYYVEDLNSSNGTWLNDNRLNAREPQELRPGDVIRMGPFLLTFIRFIMPTAEVALPALPATPDPRRRTLDESARILRDPYPPGIPRDRSTWLQYLPAIYSEDEFVGRYLLVFESMLSPLMWTLDHFDFYLTPEVAPPEWLHWAADLVDLLLLDDLPEDRKRVIIRQMGWLFLRRGTRAGLARLLELYYDIAPDIVEDAAECHFTVRMALSQSPIKLRADVLERLVASQCPAFASFSLEVS